MAMSKEEILEELREKKDMLRYKGYEDNNDFQSKHEIRILEVEIKLLKEELKKI